MKCVNAAGDAGESFYRLRLKALTRNPFKILTALVLAFGG